MSFISDIKQYSTTSGKVFKKTFGPLSALEQRDATDLNYTGLNGTSLRYPLDVGNSLLYPHTIEFQCMRPEPTILASEAVKADISAARPEFTSRGHDPMSSIPRDATTRQLSVNVNQSKTSRNTDFLRNAKAEQLIAMYLPPNAWFDRVNNQYATESMTSALGTAGLIAEAGGSILAFGKENESGWNNLKNVGTELLTKVVSKFANMDERVIRDAALQSQGYAVNPQFEVLYNSTEVRDFQFDFTMTPRNRKEADEVLNIIKAFKFHASPEYAGGGGRFVIPPSYFEIVFKYGGEINDQLPKISTCVLQNVDINYGGGLEQWAAYEDGMPIQVQMVLLFKELEMMHKALRVDGY